MRRLILLIVALATLLPSFASAYDVLVLQSRRDAAYDEVLKGFRFEKKTSLRLLVLADYTEVDVVRIVREDRPKVILAVGDAALTAVRKIQQTPVVAVMSLGIHKRSAQSNVNGIGMYGPPQRYVGLFRNMKSKRVGVVYNPAKSGWYVRQAMQLATAAGIELVAREVTSSKELVGQLASLADRVDVLWMLPDSTAVTRETTEAYFRLGQQYSIPVVSFASSYLGLGAAAVLEIDRSELGRQADAMVAALLNGDRKDGSAVEFPADLHLKTNPAVLKRLGSSLDTGNF
jgi:putative ABC transport system substrate-binding protein